MEEKKEKHKRSTKSKVITVMLSITLFCMISILLFIIFGSDLLPFNRSEVSSKPKQAIIETISRKKGILECHKDSEVTLNGYTIKIDMIKEENMDCLIGRIYINGVDETEKLLIDLDGINDYEVFGNYLIYNAGQPNSVFIGIYDLKNNTIKKIFPKDMEYFKVRSWESDDKGITFDCINDKDSYNVTNDHNTEFAQFRMDYIDGSFTDPKFVKEYGATILTQDN